MEFHPIKNIATHTLFSSDLPNNIAEYLRDYVLENELYLHCSDGDYSFETSFNDLVKILKEVDAEFIAEEIEAGWTEEDGPLETFSEDLARAFPKEWQNDNYFVLWFVH